MKQWIFFLLLTAGLLSCTSQPQTVPPAAIETEAQRVDSLQEKNISIARPDTVGIDTKNVSPGHLIAFAKTLIGVPYKYASTDPSQGFDCSGFITYVFNHFNIEVPRSSVDFTNVGTAVEKDFARPGDLVLFTGTDTLETHVGHMGIVTENSDSLRFIHSTSGKKYGVTITALNGYYLKRFVKVVRVFKEGA